ncbi:Sensory transduction protein lytR [Delftia tsuruhatensis]|uniref:LytR/AlgR family response regulator transcription factor n=1 Tax=Delftia tsuruhatensis TaxID=180282 RepID=UPI001E7A4599|nr:LytTR family DNA-binding domain-containing protein [Delftia tsuruhatensis]CAB5723617.1 Sensory transduction protein lytR [Delftia tsuruhatensis]CAC9689311.1 Sensory transduction protein lytR [Delftia tsuruhatensis]
MTAPPRALIAEDEPLLAEDLRQALARAWPELQIAATVADGLSAAREALALRPDVLFFDIRMPGQSGLEAAAELADAWAGPQPFPVLVFVTAYDQYAMDAFEAQAVDYLLKPVQPERLARSVQRLRELLARRQEQGGDAALEQALHQLRQLMQGQGGPGQAQERLHLIQAGVGSQIHMVPVRDIVYLEAADKYVRVLTAGHEYLVRTPLKDLLPRLDPDSFWQVHRGTVVRAQAIASAQRDEAGRLWLLLRERPERLAVSRLYTQRFKAM